MILCSLYLILEELFFNIQYPYIFRAFIGFTVHWIDPQTMQRKLNALACRRIMGSHSYDKLAEVIEQVLIEFNIQSKTTRLVTDNASNFAKAFRYIFCSCRNMLLS